MDLKTFCFYMLSFSFGMCNIGVFIKLLIRRLGYHKKGVILDVPDIDCRVQFPVLLGKIRVELITP